MRNYEKEILSEVCELVRIPSVSTDKENVHRALEYTLNLGKKLGFNVKYCADDSVGVIEWGSGNETLGILCHVDVVPVEPLAEWNTDPFEPKLIDGKLFGRGTLDDKGMVIACIYAMKAVADCGVTPHKKVQLIIGTQEEVKWNDIQKYVNECRTPDYGFTPDGEFPIQNIEKGIVDLALVAELDRHDDNEPYGGLHIVSLDAGVMNNSIPSDAKAVLSDGTVICAKGKTCHSSDPENGNNAIFILHDMLSEYDIVDNAFSDLLNMLTDKFRDYYGKNLDVYQEKEIYQGFYVHRSTFVPTVIHTTENRIEAVLDIRFAYGTRSSDIIDCITKKGNEIGFSTIVLEELPAVFVPENKPFLSLCAEAYERVTGLKNEFTMASGGSYAKAMADIVSWGPLFPGDIDTCHEPNEFIELDNLYKCFSVYKEAILQIVSTDKSLK